MTENNGQNRGGAPAANRNRMTWGGRGWAAIGSYPKGFSTVRRYVGRLRAELESAVCEAQGTIGVYQAALIQSACRHEGRAALLQRLLRVERGLSVTDKLAILKEIGAASDSRDKCLQRLGLDQPPRDADPWAALDAQWAPQPAPAAESGDVGGDDAQQAADGKSASDGASDPHGARRTESAHERRAGDQLASSLAPPAGADDAEGQP